jgi:hypothetical protein
MILLSALTLPRISFVDFATMTSPAAPMSYAAFGIPVVSIFGCVLMTLWTFGLLGFNGRAMTSGFDGVLYVLLRRSPVEVVQNIVVRIVVLVASMRALRSRSDEGFQDQAMHSRRPALALPKEGGAPVRSSSTPHEIESKHLALQHLWSAPPAFDLSVQRPHPTLVRNLIARVVRHWQPLLFTSHTLMIARYNTFIPSYLASKSPVMNKQHNMIGAT